jgi:hypothetical protein
MLLMKQQMDRYVFMAGGTSGVLYTSLVAAVTAGCAAYLDVSASLCKC